MSKWRKVQGGNGPGVLIYLCGQSPALDAAIKAALPGIPVAVNPDNGYGAAISDIHAGLDACGARILGCLAGYSAGCQGVRQQLWNGADPPVVLCMDGTAGPWPLSDVAREVTVWRTLATEARAGGRTFIATATMQRYTQNLKKTPTQKQGPFAATSTVLARALEWPEAGTIAPLKVVANEYPGTPALELHDGALHAFIYPGTDCDISAHAAQLTKAMPELLAKYVAPALGITVDIGPALAPFRGLVDVGRMVVQNIAGLFDGGDDAPAALPMEHLARAIAELGVAEIPGPKSNPRIDEYLSVAIRNGKPLGLRGDDQFSWCACFFSWCGLPPDMTPCAAVAEMVTQAKATGRWRAADVFHDPKPGDAALFKRSGQDPRTGGLGHIARVKVAPDASGNYVTVGGNEGAGVVKLTERNLSDPTLIGWFVYDA